MSKLEDRYNELKKENDKIIYIFKNGIFYLFFNDDAKLINEKVGLALTNMSDTLIKCGFPTNSLEKYINILKDLNLEYKIIDGKLNTENEKDYLHNLDCIKILKEIEKIDLNNTTPMQAHTKLQEFKSILSK